MSETRNMSVKAYLTLQDGTQEVRRFGVSEGVLTNYSYLEERIRDVFCFGSKNFKIHWQDFDGDFVLISSDEELLEAITECMTNQDQQLLRLYVTKTESKDESSDRDGLHIGVLCDGCDGKIYGIRYKCRTCADYDLCGSCEKRGVHKNHQFMKLHKEFPGFGFYGSTHAEGFGDHHGFRWGKGHHGRENRRCFQQQQQQRQFLEGEFGRPHGNRGDNKGKPFEFSFNNSTADEIPFMSFSIVPPSPNIVFPGTGKLAEEIGKFASQIASDHVADIMKGIWPAFCGTQAGPTQPQSSDRSANADCSKEADASGKKTSQDSGKLAEEVGKFASQIASDHVADIMKGIWIAFSGTQAGPNQPQSDRSTNADCSKEADASGTSGKNSQDSGIINIDISLDEDDLSESKSQEVIDEPEESSVPEVDLMETDEPSRTQSGQNTPSGVDEWTLLNKEKGSSLEIGQTLNNPRVNIEVSSASAPTNEHSSQPISPTLPPVSQPPHPNERVRNALEQMQTMGYSDEGGWLTRLLEMKDGDINQVLDVLLVQRK